MLEPLGIVGSGTTPERMPSTDGGDERASNAVATAAAFGTPAVSIAAAMVERSWMREAWLFVISEVMCVLLYAACADVEAEAKTPTPMSPPEETTCEIAFPAPS